MAAPEEAGADTTGAVREQDKFLPIANINRIMKEALPNNAKVSKDAKELVQQCVSDFIIYITSQASDKCKREKRKTVNGDDILWSMKSLGFDDAVVILQQYLQKIREAEGEEKSAKSGAANAEAQAAAAAAPQAQVPQGAPPPGYQMPGHVGMQPGMTAQGYPMHYGAPMAPQLMVPGVPGQVPPMMLNMGPPGHMMMPTPMQGAQPEHPQQQQQQQQQQQPPASPQ